ncbi:MAG: glycosyltransferase family 4 protein [Proteobacteria bacterium]|nr:glycosyltransferase family 4 protein [Pseudomonadota bacterium]
MRYRTGHCMEILIDTYNSATPQGTGLTTYMRSLAKAIQRIGHRVTILTAARIPRTHVWSSRPAVPAATLILDHPDSSRAQRSRDERAGEPPWVRNRVYSFRKAATALRRLAIVKAAYHDAEGLNPHDRGLLAERFGHVDGALNVPDIYQRAFSHFERTGRLLSITPRRRVNVAHFSWCLPVHIKGAFNLYTICDLIPLRFPHMTLEDKVYYYRLAKTCAQAADEIVTISESSRRDIVSLLGVPERKVRNVYLPFDITPERLERGRDAIASTLKRTFGFDDRRYFLLLGAIEPRKNIARTIEAHLGARTDMPLVICGPRSALSEEELKLIDNWNRDGGGPSATLSGSRAGGRIILFDYLPRGIVLDLIEGARALLLTSVTEGFGLTALEAMALGTPVISSRADGLAEVCGDCGVGVDPYDADTIRQAIERVSAWDDAALAAASAAGRRQAMRFSPQAFDARLAKVYDSLAH